MLYQVHSQLIQANRRKNIVFVPHAHHYYEMLVCVEGCCSVTCNFRSEVLQKGDVMIAFSNDVHSYEKGGEGEVVILIFDPSLLKPYLQEETQFENILRDGGEEMISWFEGVLKEFREKRNMEIMTGYLHLICGNLFRRLPHKREKISVDMEQFSKILNDVSQNYTQKISLKSLSKKYGISAEHLSRTFSQKLSCHFLRYLHILRVEHAKNLLKHGQKGILEIAYESGFSDQRTFNRVFRELENTTPKEYRGRYQ